MPRYQGLLSFPCLGSVQVPQKLGGSTARETDPNWPMEYSTLFTITLCTWMKVRRESGALSLLGLQFQDFLLRIASREQAGPWSVGGEQLHCTLLICIFRYYYCYHNYFNLILFALLDCFYFNLQDSLPLPAVPWARGGGVSGCVVFGCWANSNHSTDNSQFRRSSCLVSAFFWLPFPGVP